MISGYKYRTYFQHYNEPPIGKVVLKGKEIGDKYRRCYITKEELNVSRKIIVPIEFESRNGKPSPNMDKYVEESSTSKNYKKMYLDLVDKLRKIIDDAGVI